MSSSIIETDLFSFHTKRPCCLIKQQYLHALSVLTPTIPSGQGLKLVDPRFYIASMPIWPKLCIWSQLPETWPTDIPWLVTTWYFWLSCYSNFTSHECHAFLKFANQSINTFKYSLSKKLYADQSVDRCSKKVPFCFLVFYRHSQSLCPVVHKPLW